MKDIFAGLYNKIVGFFTNVEQKEADESKNVARNRLKLVLMQDRTNLNPYLLERMRGEMIDLLSKYVEMDKEALDLNFENDGESVALMLSIPVIRAKEEEEIEAALKAEDEAKKEIEEKLKALEEKEEKESKDESETDVKTDDENESEEDEKAEDSEDETSEENADEIEEAVTSNSEEKEEVTEDSSEENISKKKEEEKEEKETSTSEELVEEKIEE